MQADKSRDNLIEQVDEIETDTFTTTPEEDDLLQYEDTARPKPKALKKALKKSVEEKKLELLTQCSSIMSKPPSHPARAS